MSKGSCRFTLHIFMTHLPLSRRSSVVWPTIMALSLIFSWAQRSQVSHLCCPFLSTLKQPYDGLLMCQPLLTLALGIYSLSARYFLVFQHDLVLALLQRLQRVHLSYNHAAAGLAVSRKDFNSFLANVKEGSGDCRKLSVYTAPDLLRLMK